MGEYRVAGVILVVIGVIIVLMGAYYIGFYKKTYFESLGEIPAGQYKEILVKPGATVDLKIYRTPLCSGAAIYVEDTRGNILWHYDQPYVSNKPLEKKLTVSDCYDCDYRIFVVAPCHDSARYQVEVYYKPSMFYGVGAVAMIIGLGFIVLGLIFYRKESKLAVGAR